MNTTYKKVRGIMTKLNKDKQEVLQKKAEQLRQEIVAAVQQNGGHLAGNLGVVELTLALHELYDFSKDKILFDVGHQS